MNTQCDAHSLTKINQTVSCHLTLGEGCATCQNYRLCQARAFFMIKHTEAFFKCVLWHLWAFSLGARRDDTVFSVARLPVEFSVGRDDMGNVCCQLKKICFCAEWRSVAAKDHPTTKPVFMRLTECTRDTLGKIGAKMLCHSLGFSPYA